MHEMSTRVHLLKYVRESWDWTKMERENHKNQNLYKNNTDVLRLVAEVVRLERYNSVKKNSTCRN